MSSANGNNNEGHGHVFKRPDGVLARCGGPFMCYDCALDAARKAGLTDKSNEIASLPQHTQSGVVEMARKLRLVPHPCNCGGNGPYERHAEFCAYRIVEESAIALATPSPAPVAESELREILAEELKRQHGDGVNMDYCVAYVLKKDNAASTHDRRKLDAALAAMSRLRPTQTEKDNG